MRNRFNFREHVQQAHAKKVSAFMERFKKGVDRAYVKKAAISEEQFYSKAESLCNRWLYITELRHDAKELVQALLSDGMRDPLAISLLSDNVALFASEYENAIKHKKEMLFPTHVGWLEAAALCNASMIAFYMIGKYGGNLLCRAQLLVPYAISTGNGNFVFNLLRLSWAHGMRNFDMLDNFAIGNYALADQTTKLASSLIAEAKETASTQKNAPSEGIGI